jgi:RNA recognition motif-containing protein
LKRLFVGNLPYEASENELQSWFSQAGVSLDTVSLVRDRFSGQPRGFGFVEIPEDDADKAIAACNGQEFHGRPLVVNEARPMAERPPRSSGGGGRSFGESGGGNGGNSGGYGRKRAGGDRDFNRGGRDRRY